MVGAGLPCLYGDAMIAGKLLNPVPKALYVSVYVLLLKEVDQAPGTPKPLLPMIVAFELMTAQAN